MPSIGILFFKVILFVLQNDPNKCWTLNPKANACHHFAAKHRTCQKHAMPALSPQLSPLIPSLSAHAPLLHLCAGNTQLFDFFPQGLQSVSRKYRTALGFITGRWGLPIPRQVPLWMVAGKPITVRKVRGRFAVKGEGPHRWWVFMCESLSMYANG